MCFYQYVKFVFSQYACMNDVVIMTVVVTVETSKP